MTFAQPFTDYEILDRVGAGAMGTVFKARHKKLGRIVALKVLKPSLARDTRYVDRLRREARIVASLNHPHIVTGYDLGEEGGYHFFVMEFVEGKSLRALLVESGKFDEPFVLKVAQQVAQALDHAYQCSVIHRDIKPGNILIDDHGTVKLTDMGLAKGPADLTLTRDGATVGTPQYISPEQARNPQDVDVRCDLYSLGATLYHMATGVPPFRGDTMAELITKVLHDVPVPPNELNPAVSEGMALVIRKLLAKDLRVRYQTPRELLDDLDRLQRSLPPEVDPARLSADEGERGAGPWARVLLALGAAALLGGTFWLGTRLAAVEGATGPDRSFWSATDRALAELPTPGRRLAHLRAVKVDAPAGSETQLLARERQLQTELQSAVDAAMATLLDSGFPALVAWLRDPTVWPDRDAVHRERVLPLLRETGWPPEQLAEVVRTTRVEALYALVDRELRERDRWLLQQFETWLTTVLPVQVEERLRADDFAGAARAWANARQWFDGIRLPAESRLGPATAATVRDLHDREQRRAAPVIAAREALVATALKDQAFALLDHLSSRLRDGSDPALVAAELAELRPALRAVWPAPSRFCAETDPWPAIEQRTGALQQALQLAESEVAAQRFAARLDLVWRAVCQGSARDGLVLVETLAAPTPAAAQRLLGHQRILQAAVAVEDALIAALARSGKVVPALPRGAAGVVVEVRAEADPAGGFRLLGQPVGQPSRPAVVAEFRFQELLAQVRAVAGDPFASLPREQVALGQAVAMLCGDELQGIGPRLQQLGEPLLLDEVWPRIAAVRTTLDAPVTGRTELFARLQTALQSARAGGNLRDLEAALQACQLRVPADQVSDAEHRQLRAATQALAGLQRRQEVEADLQQGAPKGAEVAVDLVDGRVRAKVVVAGRALLPGAADHWQVQGAAVEFAGAGGPWPELELRQLQCVTGIEANPRHTTLRLDLVLPPASVGTRLYLLEFRGIAVALVVTADGGVQAALVDGNPRREEPAQRAFLRAIHNALAPAKVLALPGAVHRLTIDLQAPLDRRRAAVRVDFEGVELLAEQHELDPAAAANFVLFPRQEVAVHRVEVVATHW